MSNSDFKWALNLWVIESNYVAYGLCEESVQKLSAADQRQRRSAASIVVGSAARHDWPDAGPALENVDQVGVDINAVELAGHEKALHDADMFDTELSPTEIPVFPVREILP